MADQMLACASDYKNDPKIIHLLLQDSELYGFHVFCNRCNKCISYSYLEIHQITAQWTIDKNQILCNCCASDLPNIVYRTVYPTKDIPCWRACYKAKLNDEKWLQCDETNKSHAKFFCSQEDESRELSSKIPRVIDCECGPWCPDKLKNINLPERIRYQIANLTPCIGLSMKPFIDNLLLYDTMKDFIDDVMYLEYNGTRFKGTCTEAKITIYREWGPCKDSSLKNLKHRFLESMRHCVALTFQIEVYYQTTDFPEFRIALTPVPFIPLEGEEDMCISFIFNSDQKIKEIEKMHSDIYPPVIDGKINGKEIVCLEAFHCPGVSLCPNKNSVKKRKCRHEITIRCKDQTLFELGIRPDINASQLLEKGYIPYIEQYLENGCGHESEAHMQLCELSKEIGRKKIHKFSEWLDRTKN